MYSGKDFCVVLMLVIDIVLFLFWKLYSFFDRRLCIDFKSGVKR